MTPVLNEYPGYGRHVSLSSLPGPWLFQIETSVHFHPCKSHSVTASKATQ